MKVERFVLTPFQQNTRLVYCETTRKAICIDPGEASSELESFIRENELELQAITLTHGHFDHIGGTLALSESFPAAEVIIHKDDEFLYFGLPAQPLKFGIPQPQLRLLGFDYDAPPQLTRNWSDGETYRVGDLAFEVRHCPGHTPGHVVLAEMNERAVFVGDCLFEGSIGRTDLPGGSYEQLIDSIERQLLSLPDEFTVYSGQWPRNDHRP